MNRLKHLLDEAREHNRQNERKALTAILKEIIPERVYYFHHSKLLNRQDEYTDLLYKILSLDLDEQEEESIEIAELAYLGISEGIGSGTEENSYELIRRRIILLHYFADYLTDSIIELFLNKFRKDNLLEARNLALEALTRMQIADLYRLESHYEERINRDEALQDISNELPLELLPDQQALNESLLMHRVLLAYLKVKYKDPQ